MSDQKSTKGVLLGFQVVRIPEAGDSAPRFALKGHLDADAAPVLIEELEKLLESGVHNVELDFGEVPFISSSGVGSLIASISEYRDEGGDVVLLNMSPGLRSIFEMLDLLDYVTIR